MEPDRCYKLMNIFFFIGMAGWLVATAAVWIAFYYRKQVRHLEVVVGRLRKRLSVRWGKWGQEPNWDEITEEDRSSPGHQ